MVGQGFKVPGFFRSPQLLDDLFKVRPDDLAFADIGKKVHITGNDVT